MKERIQKLLAEAGIESRRHVEEMVLQGRVSVNGEVVMHLPVMVDPEEDEVAIDDEVVNLARRVAKERVYVVMNKPKGVYCTNVAQGEQRRCIDLLPPQIDRRLYPVGRLDADSRGLILLTNDGELTQQLTHPRFGVAKTYTCVVDGFMKPETIERLGSGIWLSDPDHGSFKTAPTFIKMVKKSGQNSVLQITLKEGRNRQVRRMLARVGHKVRELTRVKIGPLELGNLKPGDFRPLSPRELADLRKAIARTTEKAAGGDGKEKKIIKMPKSAAPVNQIGRPKHPAKTPAEARPRRAAGGKG
ncbi:MAG TPA: pseudouridine synthase [Tepidisphaeraceae bacterium]